MAFELQVPSVPAGGQGLLQERRAAVVRADDEQVGGDPNLAVAVGAEVDPLLAHAQPDNRCSILENQASVKPDNSSVLNADTLFVPNIIFFAMFDLSPPLQAHCSSDKTILAMAAQ